MSDGDEVGMHCDPRNRDTDGDGLLDGQDPHPTLHSSLSDTDGDGLSDAAELRLGTDPNRADTDGDGLSDGEEVTTLHTHPKSEDSDGDGLFDGFEVTLGLDPNSSDTDGDGFSDYMEYTLVSAKAARTHYRRTKTGPTFPVEHPRDRWVTILGQLYPDGVKPDHVRQSQIGDCYLLATFASIAQKYPDYLRDLITDNEDGTYTVKLYKNDQLRPQYIVVDNRFPWSGQYDKPFSAQTPTVSKWVEVNGSWILVDVPILWPAVLEKAAAIAEGNSYGNLTGGLASFWRANERLLGRSSNWHVSRTDKKDLFKAQLALAAAHNYPMIVVSYQVYDRDTRCQGMADWHAAGVTGRKRTNASGETEWELYNPHHHVYWMNLDDIAYCFAGGSVGYRTLSMTYTDAPAN